METIFTINLDKDESTPRMEKRVCLSVVLYKVAAEDDVSGLTHTGETLVLTEIDDSTAFNETMSELSLSQGVDTLIDGLRSLADKVESYRDL